MVASYGRKLSDIDELIYGFRFEEYTDSLLKELSTGNLKKVYLITAFALKPKLLILDESVNGLDFQSTEIIFLIAGLIGMWSVSVWVLLCIVIAEVLSLSLVVRRI